MTGRTPKSHLSLYVLALQCCKHPASMVHYSALAKFSDVLLWRFSLVFLCFAAGCWSRWCWGTPFVLLHFGRGTATANLVIIGCAAASCGHLATAFLLYCGTISSTSCRGGGAATAPSAFGLGLRQHSLVSHCAQVAQNFTRLSTTKDCKHRLLTSIALPVTRFTIKTRCQYSSTVMNLSVRIILPWKSTFLFTLRTGTRRPILLLGVRAALALAPNKRCHNPAVFAGCWLKH